jgi:hypothetical protein
LEFRERLLVADERRELARKNSREGRKFSYESLGGMPTILGGGNLDYAQGSLASLHGREFREFEEAMGQWGPLGATEEIRAKLISLLRDQREESFGFVDKTFGESRNIGSMEARLKTERRLQSKEAYGLAAGDGFDNTMESAAEVHAFNAGTYGKQRAALEKAFEDSAAMIKKAGLLERDERAELLLLEKRYKNDLEKVRNEELKGYMEFLYTFRNILKQNITGFLEERGQRIPAASNEKLNYQLSLKLFV